MDRVRSFTDLRGSATGRRRCGALTDALDLRGPQLRRRIFEMRGHESQGPEGVATTASTSIRGILLVASASHGNV